MLGPKDHVWVTSALQEDEVEKALLLLFSLRRSGTTRKLAVVASSKFSSELRNILHHAFDLVFYLDKHMNTTCLRDEEFAKLYSFRALRSFQKCVYVSPNMMAVRNCDEMFEEETKGLFLLGRDKDTSVFVFEPLQDVFQLISCGIKNGDNNGSTSVSTLLDIWKRNQSKDTGFLSGKYNVKMTQELLMGYEQDIFMVNLAEFAEGLGDIKLERVGMLGKCVADHWQKIRDNDVLPLLSHYSEAELAVSPALDQLVFPKHVREPVAIVGMSCRYPGSNNLEEFWNLLFQGQDGTCSAPDFRWSREKFPTQAPEARKTNVGFLKVPVDEFDAKFFGISPKEVLFMDPQHRLLFEVVWEGLEDACLDPHCLRGTSGSVFMGAWTNDYHDILIGSKISEFYRTYMGNSIGAAAARISFSLGMTGPSIATESACSSAMVALHLACRSLQQGETNLALACGVNLLLYPFEKDAMPMVLSPDGHCKTFSEDANGFARAEGAGVLVLKRLSDAQMDGDRIWGLIRGSAVSQEGLSKSMGTPTVHSESLAMEEALRDAGMAPEEISYVEAHGTGTVVGDPMEVAAIAKAYNSPNRVEPLIIGSVKTNVGHTESCSGMTGIMKVILSMQHEVIPAHCNFSKLNRSIDLNAVPAVIPLGMMDWKMMEGKSRIAGVSSFGITGTDAHVIVEEPPQPINKVISMKVDGLERSCQILKLSAKSDEALTTLLEKYKDFLQSSTDSIADIAFSANTGRSDFPIRAAIVAGSKAEMVKAIEQQKYTKGEANSEKVGKTCFLFTGQGAQYPGMARQLYDTSPIFRMHFDYCSNILRDRYDINITQVLWSGTKDKGDQLKRTIYSQTSIFCVEYALFKLWESWGVSPDYVLGHSLGEFAAAVCAGILSVEDAVMLVAERSRLIVGLPQGKMLVIKADRQQVDKSMKKFFGGGGDALDYAAINSSQQTVVAGDSKTVEEFSKFCAENKIKCTVLEATHAFHSRYMDPILEKYRSVAATVKNQGERKCGYISGMRGEVVSESVIDAEYWVQHTREKVSFMNASIKAAELGCQVFIEIGPQPVLSALTSMNINANLLCLPSLRRNDNEWSTILTSVARLYVNGIQFKWKGLDQFFSRKKLSLPHYPFMGKKFWPEQSQVTANAIHPLVGSVLSNASPTKLFECGLSLSTHEYLKDHAIGQTVIFPGAGYLEMCLAAGFASMHRYNESLGKPNRAMKVEHLNITAPLALEESKTTQVQAVVECNTVNDNENEWNDISVKIFHRNDSNFSQPWQQHAHATYSPIATAEEQLVPFEKVRFETAIGTKGDEDKVAEVYEKLASLGLKFGPFFRSIEALWKEEGNAGTMFAKVKIPREDAQYSEYLVHTVILDAMIQTIMMLQLTSNLKKKLYVPIKIGKFLWLSSSSALDADSELYIQASGGTNVNNEHHADWLSAENASALLVDSSGRKLAVMSGVEFIETTARTMEAILEQQTSRFPDLWEEVWRPQMGPLEHAVDMSLSKAAIASAEQKFADNSLASFNDRPDLLEIFGQWEKQVYFGMLKALYECGWEPKVNKVFYEDALFLNLKIGKQFRKQFSYFLRVFEEENILKRIGANSFMVKKMPPSVTQIHSELTDPAGTTSHVQNFKTTSLLARVGENLGDILKGTQGALGVIFSEDISKVNEGTVTDFYKEQGDLVRTIDLMKEVVISCLLSYKNLASAAGHQRYIFRLVEIGAGTGIATAGFLQVFEDLGIEFEYTYTDISAAFFPAAEQRFEKHLKHMKFKRLNIEEDPISQGFVPSFYDIAITTDVIHATKNLRSTLFNVRSLLKPDATFIMGELTRVNRYITYTFGLLEGFWHFEDFDIRPDHCTLSRTAWIDLLEDNGFSIVGAFPCANEYNSFFQMRVRKDNSDRSESRKSGEGVKTWLVFHQENDPLSDFLVDKIPELAANRGVVIVRPGKNFEIRSENEVSLRPNREEDYLQLMEKLNESVDSVEGVLYCWSMEEGCTSQEHLLLPYFLLTKSLHHLKQGCPPKLCCLGKWVIPLEGLHYIYTGTFPGFTRSLRNERVEMHSKCIYVGDQGEEDMMQVFYELWNPGKESTVGFQGKTRFVPKFIAHKKSLKDLELPAGVDRFQLVLPETNSISDLGFGTLDAIDLSPGEIEIQVRASALNFRDILCVLKPTEQFKNMNAVGLDFAGVVKRVHPQVTKWRVGDRVFGVNHKNDPFPSHIKNHEDDVQAIPESMTFGEASTLPAVMTTAYYCLIDVAQIKSTDTVLIHTASGGVGLGALALCQHVGATIIATAGSKRKQNYLRSLGIQHIFHSRNTQYGDKILEVTNGRGVDVVLNSLTSEGFKEATLKACADGARFIEMSKLNVWSNEEVKELRPDVFYQIVDLSTMEKSETARLMSRIQELTASKVIKPIPYVQFSALNIREALRFLQTAKHIGKVVCVMPEVKMKNGNAEICTPMFNVNSTYLITGGLGGIGFAVCKWMVEKGAKHVLLAGRNPPSPSMQKKIVDLNSEYSAAVSTVSIDISNFEQCKDLLQCKIKKMGCPPLRGVMHAAGTLSDSFIENHTWETLSSTLRTKVTGTLNLHELTKDNPNLEHFVLFSSMVALLGTPGQSNHAAGNSFEDSIAHLRHSMGLPATSINWGQWGEVGVATEADIPGIKPFSTLQGLNALEYALKSQQTQIAAVNIESFVMCSKICPHLSSYVDERVWKLRSNTTTDAVNVNSAMFWQQYDECSSVDDKTTVLKEKLCSIIRNILKMDETDVIEDNGDFQEMGVDSLMLVEIKNSLQVLLGDRAVVHASVVRDCNTLKLLSDALVKQIEGQNVVDNDIIPSNEDVQALIREDCIMPDDIKAKAGQQVTATRDISIVLLTGSTGTLGPYILRELSKHTGIKEIICLVRPGNKNSEARLEKVICDGDLINCINMSKVRCVDGNVAKPLLGMESKIWEELCDKVDAIFHCAASVQHMEHYKKDDNEKGMRAVNIQGTKNILQFACTGTKLKRVFYASSVVAVGKTQENGDFSEDWPDTDGYSSGMTIAYPITKYVGEVLMKSAILERGVPGKVFRFPLITGDSENGRIVLDGNHAMLRYLFILKHGIMPSNPMPVSALPVDTCAWASVKLFLNPNAPDDVYNVINVDPNPDQEFITVAKKLGFNINLVEFSEFSERIRESTTGDSLFALFKDFYQSDEDLMSLYSSSPILKEWMVQGSSRKDFMVSKKIFKYLPEFYDNPDSAIDHIYRDILFAKSQGWLEKYVL